MAPGVVSSELNYQLRSGTSETKPYELTIVRVVGLPRLSFTCAVKTHVQIDAQKMLWSTAGMPWQNGGEVRWEENVSLINPMRRSPKALEGSLEIEVVELLENPIHEPNVERTLALKGGKTCKLVLRIVESLTTPLSSAVERLSSMNPESTAPSPTVIVTDAMRAAGDTVAALTQSDLAGSLTTLLDKVGILVKIGDEIAKVPVHRILRRAVLTVRQIHPWVNLAWNVLSVGLKLAKDQEDRDNNIVSLIQTMQSTYSIVVGSENLKDERLQEVLGRILKQTVACGFFIQTYMDGRTFAGKAVTEVFSSTDALSAQYQQTFEHLLGEFTGRVATHTALTTAQLAAKVDEIRLDQLLKKLKPAVLDQSERAVCLPGTQSNAINMVLDWYSDTSDNRKSVMWLYGMAGAGKSTLSTTIARMMDRVDGIDLLGAFFFFDRNISERNASTLIRTLAYQLAEFDALFGAKIADIIEHIPDIASMPLSIQFSKLLSATALGDIQWSRGPVLVIIDSLDECGGGLQREDLIEVLSDNASKLPSFLRLLIVSRRERDILDCFRSSNMRQEELKIDPDSNRADIAAFIHSRLQVIREKNIHYLGDALQNWPNSGDRDALVNLASGHFIWAYTACRIIGDDEDPKGRMDDLIRHQHADASDDSFKKLHQLYKSALDPAVKWTNRASCTRAHDLLSAVINARVPLSCVAIDALLGEQMLSLQIVSRFGSILSWSDTGPIRILHTSFYDYLTLYATSELWHIDVERGNVQLALGCIALLGRELRENMCNLVLPQPVQNESLGEATAYASRFWVEHVCSTTGASSDFSDIIDQFLRKHLLHWMEALSIIKAYDLVVGSISKLLDWTKKYFLESELHHFVHDAHRFAQYFASTIIEHPLLVYASALPFTPHATSIYKTFYHDKLPQVVSGIEPTWPDLLQVIGNIQSAPLSACLSPDGSKIISGWDDGTVRVWDIITGQAALPPLRGHDGMVHSVSISPDGSKIVSGSEDKTVRVWDTVTGQLALPPFEGHESDVTSVSFSLEGSKIVSGSRDKTVRVWIAVSGQPALPPLQGHEGLVASVAFSPNGAMVVSGSDDNTVRLWDTLIGREVSPPLQGHESAVNSVAFSPDGTMIASGSDDNTVRLWNVITRQEVSPPFEGHSWSVCSVAFSPDNSKIVSGLSSGIVQVWNVSTREAALPPLQGHEDTIHSAVFSRDGVNIVSGSEDGTIRVWNAVNEQADSSPIQGHECSVYTIAFSPDAAKIVSGSEDGILWVWDGVTGQATLPPLQGHDQCVTTVTFSPDGSKIVSGSDDSTLRVWDVATGQLALPPLQGHEGSVTTIDFSPDGSKIVSGSQDHTLQMWDAVTGRTSLPPLQGHEDEVHCVAFSPNGRMVASGSEDQTVRLWDAVTGEAALPPLEGHEGAVGTVFFSPDGTKIISRTSEVVRIWDTCTGKLLEEMPYDKLPYLLRHYSSRILVTDDEDGYFREVNSGRHLGKVPWQGFTPDHKIFYKSSCVMMKKVSEELYVPIVIHFPL
ncbi:hypothetical protein HWV62_6110 [Athelia sp. TMB]|nr:hypothetical protein HWV62_6110 [Athelia sp. TMB]